MQRLLRKTLLIVALAMIYEGILLWAIPALAEEETQVIWIEIVPTPTPTPMPAPPATPKPTPTTELPIYEYPAEDARCLSRGIWSVSPASPTRKTRLAFCELVQNRVDDASGDFEDSIRWVLLQGNEFKDYDPDAHRSETNNEVADYAMRSWIYAKATGDRTYRLVPQDGLYCDFYRLDGRDYIKIYNRTGDVVYDSGR